MDKKIITRAERQERLTARNQKLNDHINQGVKDYVQSAYNDSKEARKNARWYETGEALVEAKIQGQYDADSEFVEEFAAWAEKEQNMFHAELDARETELLEAEDDVIDVEFKPLLPLSLSSNRNKRKSLLGQGDTVTPVTHFISASNVEMPTEKKENKFYGARKLPE